MNASLPFFILLRAGLWEKIPEDLSLFPLSVEEWAEVFRLAQLQTVTGLVYRGIMCLPDGLLPGDEQLFRWVAQADAVERVNRRMNEALLGLYVLFGDNGLSPVLQKGQGVAQLYEEPLLRECGDIDLYFPIHEERKRATGLLMERNIRLARHADGSSCYRWKGVVVEHHTHLLDVANPFMQGRLEEVERHYGYATFFLPSEAGKKEIRIPAPASNLLLLNTHVLKHALGWGIGLRQLCDFARACYVMRECVSPVEMRALCRKLGIVRWTRLLHSFVVEHLGVLPEWLPYEDASVSSAPLLEIVLRGGNFGLQQPGRQMVQPAWRHKWRTSCSFLQNTRFACRYAPKEAFWTFVELLF